jgi:hypothetical protein
VKANMFGKLGFFGVFLAILATACLSAQQKPQPASASAEGVPGRIKCNGQPYVSITADAEQALPLQLVTRAACQETVTILSDPQAYTVKVRTAAGKMGYVTRYEVVVDSAAKESAIAPSASATKNRDSSVVPPGQQPRPPAGPGPASEEKSSSKPRIFISDSESWTESGGFTNSTGVVPGYNPEMVDIYQDFTSDCPAVAVVQEKADADYAVLFDKGAGKKGLTGLGGLVKVNKVTVLSRSGETLISQASHSADAAVSMACNAVTQKATTTRATQPNKAVP